MDRIDILTRETFVENLINLIENISDNDVTTCFAIDGAWGCGKSFVLDMLEEQLETAYSEKHFVIRYNSWKYDYYEEPLIAIVSAMIAAISEKTELISDDEKKKQIIEMLKSTGDVLLSLGNSMVKAKTGVDLKKGLRFLLKARKAGTKKYNEEHAYDTYLGLNKVIDKLSDSLKTIAKEYSVIIIVDELDRCVPEYAIKVLERLHHLTEGKNNIVTVIAVDKKRLEASVKHTFGFDDPGRYLEKFINFEVKIDKGTISDRIVEKYKDYLGLFDESKFCFEESSDECVQAIFNGIDIRTQEQIMKKVILAHNLLYADKKDYSFMCVELIIAVMYYLYNYRNFIGGNQISISSFDSVFVPYSNSDKPKFVQYFSEKFAQIDFKKEMSKYFNEPSEYIFPEKISLYSAILFTWYYIHNKYGGRILLKYIKGEDHEKLIYNCNELKRFIETLQFIK